MSALSSVERIHRDRIGPYRHWVEEMLTEPPVGLKFAKEPLLTDEQKYFPEYLQMTDIRGDFEDHEPDLICPKCKCHSPAFSGGDNITEGRGMRHYTFWTCLNPDCKHWWMLGDDE